MSYHQRHHDYIDVKFVRNILSTGSAENQNLSYTLRSRIENEGAIISIADETNSGVDLKAG
jgi:hypothetical protein